MVDWSQFFRDGGTRLNIGRVTEVGVSTVFGAIFTGVASVVLGLADIPLALLGGFADFIGRLVSVLTGLPALVVRGSWNEAIAFVMDAGIAGYVVAIAIVLASTYVIAWGVNAVGSE